MTFKFSFAALAALFVANFCSAQGVLASNDGLKATFLPDRGCDRRVELLAVADEAHLFFSRQRLEGLLAASRIALSMECANPVTSITLSGRHDDQYLGSFTAHEVGGWKLHFPTTLGADPLWQAAGAFVPSRNSAPVRGAPTGAAANAAAPVAVKDRKFFYIPPGLTSHNWFGVDQHFASGAVNGRRYTTMSKFLSGESYMFFPYTTADSQHTVNEPVLPELLPEYSLTIGTANVFIRTADRSETVPLVRWLPDPELEGKAAGIECFRSELMPSTDSALYPGGYCFMVVQVERNREFFHYLASPNTDAAYGGRYVGLTIFGKLKSSNPQEIDQMLSKGSTAQASLDAADMAAIAAGKPKPTLRAPYLATDLLPFFRGLYSEEPIPTTANVGNIDIMDRYNFLTYHNIYDQQCLTSGEPSRAFVRTDTRLVDEETYGNTTVRTLEEYVSVQTNVRDYAYDHFKLIGDRMPSDLFAESLEDATEMGRDFVQSWQDLSRFLDKRALALNDIVTNEGCRSPTLRKLERAIDARVGLAR